MSYTTTKRTNLVQNSPNFRLPENLPPIFKKGLFTKTLDPIQPDPTQARTVTVKCTYKNCK